LILAREILKSAPGPEVRVYESLSGEQVRVRESAEVCNAGGDRQSDTMPLATVFCWHEYQSRLFVFAALHSAPLTNTPCFPKVVLLERRHPWKTRALRSNHNICGFVMDGFFCRFLLFGNFGLSWFMDMLFHFLGVPGKVFKDFPGDLEVLFYYER